MNNTPGKDRASQLELAASELGEMVRAAFEEEPAVEPVVSESITRIVAGAEEVDFYSNIERAMADLAPIDYVRAHLLLSDRFREARNRVMALDCLAEAEEALLPGMIVLLNVTLHRYLLLGEPRLAAALLMKNWIETGPVPAKDVQAMRRLCDEITRSDGEHGHVLLLSEFQNKVPAIAPNGRQRILVEVGTTRERVPGQGSTLKLAQACAEHGLHMITVDMDPRNSALARRGFERLGVTFQCVTARGEDYLEQYDGPIDFVFLDAYDFDHGQHSELRQSRYEAFLGSRINEEECHQMHLRCAQALSGKLSADGLICIDDTWRDTTGSWTAKGTLAVPYLIEQGFEIVKAAKRAVLMRRGSSDTAEGVGL